MRLMMIETPRGIGRATALTALRDSILRHESPIYPALTICDAMAPYTLEAMEIPATIGAEMEHAWVRVADGVSFYMDNGFSPHMERALSFIASHRPDMPMEFRWIAPPYNGLARNGALNWDFMAGGIGGASMSTRPPSRHRIADTDWGRIEVCYSRRPPTPPAPFEVKLAGATVAFYASMEAGLAGAEAFYNWRKGTGISFAGLPGIKP